MQRWAHQDLPVCKAPSRIERSALAAKSLTVFGHCMLWPSNLVLSVNLKNKTFSYLSAKWVYLGIAKNSYLGHESYSKAIGKSIKQRRGTLFYRERGSWKGLCGMKTCWRRRARVQGADRFSLAKLRGWSSSRRCDVHLSLLGPVIEDSFLLMILVLGSVMDSFPMIDVEWYSSSSPASHSSLPSPL